MTDTAEPCVAHKGTHLPGGGDRSTRQRSRSSPLRRPSHRGIPRPMRARADSAALMGLAAKMSQRVPTSAIEPTAASAGTSEGRRAAPAGDGNAAGRMQPQAGEPTEIPAQQWGRTVADAEGSASWLAPCVRFSFNGARRTYGKRWAPSDMPACHAWRQRQNAGSSRPSPCAVRMHRPVQAQPYRRRTGSGAAKSMRCAVGLEGLTVGVGCIQARADQGPL